MSKKKFYSDAEVAAMDAEDAKTNANSPTVLPNFDTARPRKFYSDAEVAAMDAEDAQDPSIPTKTESAVRGAAEGASLGLIDEATGALGVVKNLKNIVTGPDTIKDTYKKERDESRLAYDAAEKANPKSYLAGQIGGSAATTLIPGLGIGGGLGMAALKGAAQGAVGGIGYSKKESLADLSMDAAAGGLVGGVAGGISFGLSKIIKDAPTKAKQIIRDTGDTPGKQYLAGLNLAEDMSKEEYKQFNKEITKKLGKAGGRLVKDAGKAVAGGYVGSKIDESLGGTGVVGGLLGAGATGAAGLPETAKKLGTLAAASPVVQKALAELVKKIGVKASTEAINEAAIKAAEAGVSQTLIDKLVSGRNK